MNQRLTPLLDPHTPPAEKHPGDDVICNRFHGGTPPAASRPHRPPQFQGFGFFALFLIASVFFALNSKTLFAMDKSVSTQKRQTEEAKKPATVEVTAIVAPTCAACNSLASFMTTMTSNPNVRVVTSNSVDYASPEGAALVKQYNLARVPTLVIRGQVEKLLVALPGLKGYGQTIGDTLVGTNIVAPYVDIASGKVRGEFLATYVTEKQCATCYDPTVNRQSLLRLGLKPTTEKTIDRNDANGQKLVKQYKLASTPTLVLSGDLTAYSGFDTIWKQVGTIESDGAYVFRNDKALMGTYYDLATKKPVAPKTAATKTTP